MLEIRAKLKVPRGAYRIEVKDSLRLPSALRRKNGFRARLDSGEEVALALVTEEILRGGDFVVASDGRVIEVVAAEERLLHVTCATVEQLARCAYHLGRNHVPLELGEAWLRVAADAAIEEMLKTLGAAVTEIHAPFEPELASCTAERGASRKARGETIGEDGGAHGGHSEGDAAHGHAHCDHPAHRHEHGH